MQQTIRQNTALRMLSIFALSLLTSFIYGQTADMPRPSPKASISQTIGVTKIDINYSRPKAKGRSVFGTLVPYEKVWRTGANESTNISFEHDVVFGGKEIKAGSYALLSIPNKGSWTIILNNDYKQFGAYNYSQEKDATRIQVTTETSSFFDMFTIMFSDIELSSGNLELRWENTLVKIPIQIDTDAITIKEFEKADKKISDYWYTFSAAGHYYHEIKKDDKKAIEYLNKAIGLKAPNPSPWMLKSQILANAGKYREAIKVANEALEVSRTIEEFHFEIEENKEAIKKWQKLLKK